MGSLKEPLGGHQAAGPHPLLHLLRPLYSESHSEMGGTEDPILGMQGSVPMGSVWGTDGGGNVS